MVTLGLTDDKGMCAVSRTIELRAGEGMEGQGQDVEGMRRRWMGSVEWKWVVAS